MESLTTSQRETIYYCNLAAGVFSIIGSTFIILLYLFHRPLQTFPFKLISILSIFDFFNTIGFMIPTYNASSSQIICKLQAIIINFFTLGSILWSAVIAISLYMIALKSKLYVQKYLQLYLIIIVILCIADTIVPYLLDSYGKVEGWCWITQRTAANRDIFQRYLLFFVPLWLVVICNVSLYLVIASRLRKSRETSENINNRISLSKKLKYYPLILIVCYLPYTVKGALELFDHILSEDMVYYFTIIAGISRGINGILNAVVYGLTKKVRNKLSDLCFKEQIERSSYQFEIKATLTNSIPNSKYTILTNNDILCSQDSLNSS